jgi:hypothetical protein
MTITYDIDRNRELTLFRFSGDIRLDDLIETIYDYFRDGFTRYEIYDLTGFDGSPFSAADIDRLAGFLRSRSGNFRVAGKTAIVAPRDIDYGNFRMLAALTDIETPYEFEVFRTIEGANDWLSRSPDTDALPPAT